MQGKATGQQARAIRLWRGTALFAAASDAALAAAAAASEPFSFGARQVLFQRGDSGGSVHVLAEGRVKLALLSPQGRELVLRQAEAGDTLGELAFLDGSPRSAMAQAVEAGSGLSLGRVQFDRIEPGLRSELLEAALHFLTLRLRETTDQLESIALYGLSGRLARFFLFTLRQLHGDDLPPEPRLQFQMTQGELAAILGASRPKVNRALALLETEGAVRREGAAFLCLPDRLEALATDAEG